MVTAVLVGLPRLGQVDVVIASSPTLFSALSGWVIARLKRVPFVMEVRDLWPEAILALGLMQPGLTVTLLQRLARFLYRQAACVVVVTEAFAERLAEQGVAGEKLVVIPNAIDVGDFARSPFPDLDPRPYPIGFIGRLDPVKRVPLDAYNAAILDRATVTHEI